ncbi:MAG: hypothetical protein ABSG46_14325 [Candidatus Binataceae bacterium]|jgi:hypothetical protein
MLSETLKMLAPEGSIRNAISESRVLHARNLCDFCSAPWRPTDIKPKDLFDNYDTAVEYSALRSLVGDVATAYRTDACAVIAADGTSGFKSPKWAFDKMLAHPTQDRGTSFNYQPFLDLVVPKLRLVADEIRHLEKAQGRDFPSFDVVTMP